MEPSRQFCPLQEGSRLIIKHNMGTGEPYDMYTVLGTEPNRVDTDSSPTPLRYSENSNGDFYIDTAERSTQYISMFIGSVPVCTRRFRILYKHLTT